VLTGSGIVHSARLVALNPFLDERGRATRHVVELIGTS
jgi:hypothetical protein